MAASDNELAALFLEFSRNKLFGQYWPRLKESVAPLTEEQVWWRPSATGPIHPYSVLISIANRYFTSCFSSRSKASLIFCMGITSTSAVIPCWPQ